MLFQGILMLLLGLGLEKKNGPVRRKKIPYIIKNKILENSEQYYLNCLKKPKNLGK